MSLSDLKTITQQSGVHPGGRRRRNWLFFLFHFNSRACGTQNGLASKKRFSTFFRAFRGFPLQRFRNRKTAEWIRLFYAWRETMSVGPSAARRFSSESPRKRPRRICPKPLFRARPDWIFGLPSAPVVSAESNRCGAERFSDAELRRPSENNRHRVYARLLYSR